MNLIRRSICCATTLVALACNDSTAPISSFTHVAAVAACGPADGPAVAIIFSSQALTGPMQSPPYIAVMIQHAFNEIIGTWPIGTNTETGARYQISATEYEWAKSGFIITKAVAADGSIEGSVDIKFPTRGELHTQFRAPRSSSGVLCR